MVTATKTKTPPPTTTATTVPLTAPSVRPLIPTWVRALPGAAVSVAVTFASLGCGDSPDSPSCKGSNVANAGIPKDAKDPNGAKAPGKPGDAEGFEDPKSGEEWVTDNKGRGGWLDAKGKVWQPTGQGSRAHDGSHWDVQNPDGTYINVYSGGGTR